MSGQHNLDSSEEKPSHFELFEAGAYDNYMSLSISKDDRRLLLQIGCTSPEIGRGLYESIKAFMKQQPIVVLSESSGDEQQEGGSQL